MNEDIMLGCDPEFRIQGYEARWFIQLDGCFGRDGCPSICELRPKPANSALELVSNIQAIIETGVERLHKISDIPWLAGHFKEEHPLGGHIHIGNSLTYLYLEQHSKALQKILYNGLSEAIDDLDEREQRNHHYGLQSVYRENDYNGIEFRLPGSWLLSPDIAFMNLWLAKAVTLNFMARLRDGFNSPFKRMSAIKGQDLVLEFYSKLPSFITHEDGDLFLRVADKIFSRCPIDWKQDFKRNWI